MDREGLSPRRLSDLCGGAFQPRSIFRWKAGDSVPGAEAVPLLCAALKVDADWLLGMSSAPRS